MVRYNILVKKGGKIPGYGHFLRVLLLNMVSRLSTVFLNNNTLEVKKGIQINSFKPDYNKSPRVCIIFKIGSKKDQNPHE